ncbi:MAG: tetratricopeptide repeat protein, partial [Myxococcota bacterium]
RHTDGVGEVLFYGARPRGERPEDLSKRLRGDLDWLTLKAVAHDPARRYGSAEELAADIERFLDHRPVIARAPTTGYVLRKLMQRHRGKMVATAVVVAALILGTVGTTIGYVRARDEAERANLEAEAARQAQRNSQQLADFMTELFKSSHPDRPNASTVTARELLDRGAERLTTELDEQPRVRASLQHAIANVFLVWGLPKQAEPLLASAIEVIDQPGATPGHDTLAVWADWSNLNHSLGRYEEAIEFAERALASPTLGEQSADFTARLEYRAGMGHLRLGRLPASEKHFRNMQDVLDADNEAHFQLLSSALLYIGRIREREGRNEEALDHYRKSLELREGRGPDRSVSTVYQAIGGALTELHRFDEAEAALRKSIELSIKVLGPDSVKVAGQLSFLGYMLTKQGRHEKAVETYHQALAIQRRHLGSEHPEVAITLTNLAQSTRGAGAPFAQWASLYREASVVFGKALPDVH